MFKTELSIRPRARIALTAYSLASVSMIFVTLAIWSGGCNEDSEPIPAIEHPSSPQVQSAGSEFLIGLLDELSAIADGVMKSTPRREMATDGGKRIIASTAIDTTFVYGEVTPDGFGAVVTERHQYPKGLLLITVRKTHGVPQGGIVSETRKYISFEDLRLDSAQQSNVTDVY